MIISPWVRNRMIFRAADGGEGGGAAVLDAPAAQEPLGSVGEAYTDALKRAQGKEPPDRTPAASGPTGPASTGPSASGPASTGASGPSASGATGPAAKEKPATALDALMDDQPAASGATGTDETEKNPYLKDLPETLPREGRGGHWERARAASDKQWEKEKEQAKTVADLTRQLEEAKAGSPQSSAELEATRKERDQYKDIVVATSLKSHPEHIKEFLDGRKVLVSKASDKLTAFGGNGKLIVDALGMPEGRGRTQAIKEALSDLEQVDQNRVLQFVSEVEKLDDRRAEKEEQIDKDPYGPWAKLQESEKARAQEAVIKAEEFKTKVFETVSKTLPDKFFLLRTVDESLPDAANHNSEVDKMKVAAFELLGPKAKPEDLVEAAYAKQMVPKLQQFLVETRNELRAARAALKEYEGAEPGFRGGKAPEKTGLEAQLDKTPGQLWTESLAKQRGE